MRRCLRSFVSSFFAILYKYVSLKVFWKKKCVHSNYLLIISVYTTIFRQLYKQNLRKFWVMGRFWPSYGRGQIYWVLAQNSRDFEHWKLNRNTGSDNPWLIFLTFLYRASSCSNYLHQYRTRLLAQLRHVCIKDVKIRVAFRLEIRNRIMGR